LTFWKSPNQKTVSAPTNRPNPFAVLKVGKKAAIVAVVDSGSISFFKFGQGVFPDWPMQ
jgi:tRNA-splicing endonuclease subunit Sen54